MSLSWRRMCGSDTEKVKSFLINNEEACVNACVQFKTRDNKSAVWILTDKEDLHGQAPEGLVIYKHRTLFPVLNRRQSKTDKALPPPPELFLQKLCRLGKNPVYGLQGSRIDALFFEGLLSKNSLAPREGIDYDLMELGTSPHTGSLFAGPSQLRIRKAGIDDLEALLPVQTAYEKEEVLPPGSPYNSAVAALDLSQLLKSQTFLMALMDGKIVGKVNSTGSGFHCTQIGGVYVSPGYRRLGIATRLVACLAAEIIAQGRQVTLFVKKSNLTAQSVYTHAGFKPNGDYRIAYY